MEGWNVCSSTRLPSPSTHSRTSPECPNMKKTCEEKLTAEGSAFAGHINTLACTEETKLRGKLYFIIANISKRTNIRSLLLTAAAFGCQTVFVAGQRKFDFDPDGIDIPHQCALHIKSGSMKIVQFDKLDECAIHIKSIGVDSADATEGPVRIIGVEIHETAVDLEDELFVGDTAFMMGNEGQGMNQKQMSICDGFIRIAQYGGGTASLNVNVAASIVLHRFHHWARGDQVGKIDENRQKS